MAQMKIMDPREGHVTVEWDTQVPESVEVARHRFEQEVRDKKMKPYRMERKNGKSEGTAIKGFDPEAEELLLVAPMAGGC